ncbi:IMS domain-containing protein [Synechococcus sp. RS9902]|uniref:IMS domain-containing protein n=1 Tax=Synechococcus sp. RS9902 TaxID=221345 RepID=UPI00164898F1|nr:IMS domain-containing protein [Synechococcus sp. RS9902]QNI98100.1 cell division protein ZipN [Synechococcus sp. RS9902]
MDLPIDHFRLLGVSPSAGPEAILRRLETRCDSPPDQGFTHEVLLQRADLLRRSADLLTDPADRAEYEAALLRLSESHPNGTVGLDLPTSSEVAGLMLLWEAHGALEAFQLARQGLQPPQAPALGSGREADLTLLAALACRDAAVEEQDQRRYESAAQLLIDGIELQQRMGKLPDQQRQLEDALQGLTPFRILDLLSRDLGDQDSHQRGLTLLDELVVARGGLEAADADGDQPGSLSQEDFESFFHQIRRFLTVQEQIDLFSRWFEGGAADAGFLTVLALTAAGFSRRKPEFLEQARDRLQTLANADLDPMPLLGCLDLLLGNVKDADRHFAVLRDTDLQAWFLNHPGDRLAAQCEYCRAWLERDVLPGYRDVDASGADLDAWFADRDVQGFVDRLDRKASRQIGAEEISLAWAMAGDASLSASSEAAESDQDVDAEDADATPFWQQRFWQQSWFRPAAAAVALVGITVAGFGLVRRNWDPAPLLPETASRSFEEEEGDEVDETQELDAALSPVDDEPIASLKPDLEPSAPSEPLVSDAPTEAELQALLQGWLDAKALMLSGEPADLSVVAREPLVKRVEQEREADQAAERSKSIDASITTIEVVDRSPQRIELLAQVAYSDRLQAADGTVIDETAPTDFIVTYVLGRDGTQWRLHDYIPGS